MQPRTRKTLTILWVIVIIAMVLPLLLARVANLGVFIALAWFAAVPLSILTFRRSGHAQHLQRPGWYRAALVVQLLVSILGIVTAAHTVAVDGKVGLVSIATVYVLVAILTWRAITKPDARRAVGAALVAELVPFVALMVDIALDVHFSPIRTSPIFTDMWGAFAITAVFLEWVGAALVCVAALHVFGQATSLPDARTV